MSSVSNGGTELFGELREFVESYAIATNHQAHALTVLIALEERVESLERQLDVVDDALEWKGTGEGRVSMALSGKVAQYQLRDLWVRELYTEEGAAIWVKDSESKGHSIVKQLQRLDQLRTGAFA